jgi:RNA polymerase sigma-54 factor
MVVQLDVNLTQRPELKLTLTPELLLSLDLLQFTSLELAEWVEQELEKNPVLEQNLQDNDGEEKEIDDSEKEVDIEKDFDMDWEDYFNDGRDLGYRGANYSDDDKDSFETYTPSSVSLFQHLQSQLQLVSHKEIDYKIGLYLISSIDKKGYFNTTIENVSEYFNVSTDKIEEIRLNIMKLDPVGICSKNLQEFILVQLMSKRKLNRTLVKMVNDMFDLVQKRKINSIARKLKTSPEYVEKSISELSELMPYPTYGYNGGDTEKAQFIEPDVLIKKINGEWIVIVNDSYVPVLRINKYYKQMIFKKNLKSDEKEFLKNNINSAQNLIKAINQRHLTMYKVTKSIVEHQKDFFEKGIRYLKPMILKDIADDVKMSESTVSRSTRGKYAQTPYGVFELKFFFSNGLPTDNGKNISSVTVKEKVKDLIENEDITDPISDTEIWKKLKESGIHIERKTIQNYRESLGILPKHLRRRLNNDN